MGIYRPDGSLICTGNDLLHTAMQHYNPNDLAFRDATGEEKLFEMGQLEPRFQGEPMCLLPYAEGKPTKPIPITKLVITGPMQLEVVEAALTHGNYDGINYSAGKAALADGVLHLVATENESGVQWVLYTEAAN